LSASSLLIGPAAATSAGAIVVGVAGAEQKNARPSRGIGQRVDPCRASAARAADGFAERPLVPPPAERWALIVELSITTVPMIPCRLHRLKRL
jgi:hypothetical protein